MYIPITTAALALLTIAMILLRVFWLRLPSRLRSFLIYASISAMAVQALAVLTKWNTTSDRMNAIINWLAIAGYELVVLLFSRLSPRWLTLPSAAVLLVPIFASSILIPLTHLFETESYRRGNIEDHLFYEVNPWMDPGGGNTGVDVNIYHRLPFVPFLRHRLQTIPFNNQECDADHAFAVSLPSTNTILGRCPYWPSQPPGTFDRALPLR